MFTLYLGIKIKSTFLFRENFLLTLFIIELVIIYFVYEFYINLMEKKYLF